MCIGILWWFALKIVRVCFICQSYEYEYSIFIPFSILVVYLPVICSHTTATAHETGEELVLGLL